jgi:hypothetical protein
VKLGEGGGVQQTKCNVLFSWPLFLFGNIFQKIFHTLNRSELASPDFWNNYTYEDILRRAKVLKKACDLEFGLAHDSEELKSTLEDAKQRLKQSQDELISAKYQLLLSKCFLLL